VRDYFLGDHSHRGVGVLGHPGEEFKRSHRTDFEALHHDALGLTDHVAAGQRRFELMLAVFCDESDRGVGGEHRGDGLGFIVESLRGKTEQV
jgi:hypothetical protein